MGNIVGIALLFLIASGAAVEAKEPTRPEPAHHATGCEWAGPGFIKAEGSDTCVKVGGSVRAEFSSSTTKPAYLPGLPDQ